MGSSALPPPPFEDLRDRPFSFYPPIVGIEHNEWRLVEATWSELLVRNTAQPLDLAIPRSYFDALSQVDDPVIIVGLKQELEYRAGAVWPHRRKVIAMSSTGQTRAARPPVVDTPEPKGMSRITGTGATGTEARLEKLIFAGLGIIALVSLLAVAVVKLTPVAKPTFLAKDQQYLDLNKDDDIFAVQRKLGKPTEDHWKPGEGEIAYRAVNYKDRGYTIILMGPSQEAARYIGTMNANWQPIHTVDVPGGTTTASLLRSLPKF